MNLSKTTIARLPTINYAKKIRVGQYYKVKRMVEMRELQAVYETYIVKVMERLPNEQD